MANFSTDQDKHQSVPADQDKHQGVSADQEKHKGVPADLIYEFNLQAVSYSRFSLPR